MRIEHIAECPEISPTHCAEEDIPEHLHVQSIDWIRLSPAITAGLGKGWQGVVSFPLDAKNMGIAYTLDGDPYDPPYAGIHHRNELLAGPADGTLAFERFFGLGELGMWSLKAGTSLPVGRTEEDPYTLASAGLEHQHFQMGTGTFIPVAEASAVLAGLRLGGLAWVRGRFPVYANPHGYHPGAHYTAGAGATYRLTPKINAVVTTEYTLEAQDAWTDTASPSSGRQAVVFDLGGSWGVTDRFAFASLLRGTAWQKTLTENSEDQLLQRFIVTVGGSWTLGKE
jgi:hypothetical protein